MEKEDRCFTFSETYQKEHKVHKINYLSGYNCDAQLCLDIEDVEE